MWRSPIPKLPHKIWQAFLIFHEFIRFAAFGFSVMLPLLGAATVTRHLSIPQTLGLIVVALNFHGFSFVFNDVIDLPIDRTQALRTQSPLVRGVIRPRQALVFALLQIPSALLITFWLGGNGWAYVTLSAGFC
jgi:4-hydroxybenzoate polyprenyltransferase